jgi:hypothetical protein
LIELAKVNRNLTWDQYDAEIFKDTSDPSSDFQHDMRSLQRRGLIKFGWKVFEQSKVDGSPICDEAGVAVTRAGMDEVREFEQGWVSKAIEKQPITFLQVIILAAQIIAGSTAAFYLWRWKEQLEELAKRLK